MSAPISKVQHPPPRSLLTIDGARRQLARVICETKLGLLDPQVAGRIGNMLGMLITSAKHEVFEARLDALEAKLAEAETLPPRANGYHGSVARTRS